MKVIFKETNLFQNDLNRLSTSETETVVRIISRMAKLFKDNRGIFLKEAIHAPVTLKSDLESSLYILRVDKKLRILFTADEDPIFNQIMITLFRITTPDMYMKAFSQLVKSLYKNTLLNYSIRVNGRKLRSDKN